VTRLAAENASPKGDGCARKHCHAKPFAREHRESDARQEAAPEFLSAHGAREGCGTSPCRHCIPELPRLPRNSGLDGSRKITALRKGLGICCKARGPHLNFLRGKLLESVAQRSSTSSVLAFLRLGVDGNILLQMALKPALMIQRFANGDADRAKFQRAALVGKMRMPRKAFKNFLEPSAASDVSPACRG